MAEEQEQGGLGTGVASGEGDGAPSIIDAEGNFQEGWRKHLDEGIRGEACLDRIKNFGDMAKSYVSAMKTFGANRVVVPGEKATDEEWDAYYVAGGRPSAPEGYNLQRPEDLPEELYDESTVNEARTLFHKIGLNQKQAEALLAFDSQRALAGVKAGEEAEATRMKETSDALRKDWGANYDRNMHLGNIAIEHGTDGNAELKARIVDRYGNNPDFIRFAAAIGAKFDEHKIVHDSRASVETAGQIDAKIAEAQNHPAYLDRRHPQHQQQLDLLSGLFKKKAAASKGQS